MQFAISMGSFHGQNPTDVEKILSFDEIADFLFPARLAIAPEEFIEFESPNDFSFSTVPSEFHPENGFVIPLESFDGFSFRFTGFYSAQAIPSTLVIRFSEEQIRHGMFNIKSNKALLARVIPIQNTSNAFLVDIPSLHREGANRYFRGPAGKRYPIRFEWMTFYSRELVGFIGMKRFDRIRSLTTLIEFEGGLLTILQDEPFDHTNPAHRSHRDRVERTFGVEDIVK